MLYRCRRLEPAGRAIVRALPQNGGNPRSGPAFAYAGLWRRRGRHLEDAMTTQGQAAPVQAARDLAPRIAAAADQIEREQRIPADLVAALADGGLFKMLVPLSLGGGEHDLVTLSRAIEAVAKADASVAWCVAQACGTAMRMAYLQPTVAEAIITPRLAVLASGTGPLSENRAVAEPGGYRVSGQWHFASGGHNSTFMCAEARLYEAGGTPRLSPEGKHLTRIMMFPATEVTWRDTWQVSGLRGTGSDTYTVNGLFVPQERTCHDMSEAPKERGPLYVFPIRAAYSAGFASVAFGIVRAMLDVFEQVAASKQPRAGLTVLRENAVVQSQVARAEAQLGAARAYMYETLNEAWGYAAGHGELTLEHRVRLRLSTTHAIQQAAQAGDMIHMATGATAVFTSSPFERRFRDLHAVTAHVQGHQLHYETAGQFFLGLDPDRSWI
jgi:alkylation response protein AidB-like acyl-CoA dehydrogenase